MSGESINADDWFTKLVPPPIVPASHRPGDPRLGEYVFTGEEGIRRLGPNVPALIGFPQDEGVRRNGGRVGAAAAPDAVRDYLYRLVGCDPRTGSNLNLVDLGNVRVSDDLEDSQSRLAEVVAGVLRRQAVPIVLGGGHETAWGVYQGHARLKQSIGVINLDAHLDVRPTLNGLGHSGSPFRQMLEHPDHPLPPGGYVCLGAQPAAVSRDHANFVNRHGGVIAYRSEVSGCLVTQMRHHLDRMRKQAWGVHLSIDADVVIASAVPGVSAPSPLGLGPVEVADCAYEAGGREDVTSLELVELVPALDIDARSIRWAAHVIWHFLAGLQLR